MRTISRRFTLAGDPRITLNWSAVADPECATDRYHVYRDGKKVAEARGTSYTDAGLAELTAYAYQVAAVNMADLEGPKSRVTRARTLADTGSPTVPTR
jgi:chitodextrinase